MSGDTFTFKGSRTSRYRVTVSTTGVTIVREIEGRPQYSKTHEAIFAHVLEVTLHDVKLRSGGSEGLYLQTRAGGTVGFAVNSSRASGASGEDVRSGLEAATAVMGRLVEARPDMKVRVGQSRQFKMMSLAVLLMLAAVLTGLFLTVSGRDNLPGAVAIFTAMVVLTILPSGLLKKPTFVSSSQALGILMGKSMAATLVLAGSS